jgi:hypothetical protein
VWKLGDFHAQEPALTNESSKTFLEKIMVLMSNSFGIWNSIKHFS